MTFDHSPSERRLFARFPARFPAKFKDTRDEYGTKVYIRDASAQGVHLTTKEHVYINDNLSVEVKLPDSDNPMSIRGQVVWAKRLQEDIWDVGLKCHEVNLMRMARLYKFVASV
jgi:Tfp pilus assembly protein PilZ